MSKIKEAIKALGETDWGKDNEAQMKAVQLLKGIATSEEPESNEFMKALSDSATNIAKLVLEEDHREQHKVGGANHENRHDLESKDLGSQATQHALEEHRSEEMSSGMKLIDGLL